MTNSTPRRCNTGESRYAHVNVRVGKQVDAQDRTAMSSDDRSLQCERLLCVGSGHGDRPQSAKTGPTPPFLRADALVDRSPVLPAIGALSIYQIV
jgi:hypothetical protein